MDIDLTELGTDLHHFLTTAAGLNFAHAASVCLESERHEITCEMKGTGHYTKMYNLKRFPVSDEMKRTWNDDEFTTEQGAYGVAIVMASREMNIKAIIKSKKKTGIDYWLGDRPDFLFQSKVRLEVSGIRKGNDSYINTRFEDKMTQSKKSDGTQLPALIAIIEFGTPEIRTGLRIIS
ncbi:MAG: hypothetical protein HYU70_08650 [Bacteroidetes bacterium]|nr:hypothetical protein [Bacteroidota bacterium]